MIVESFVRRVSSNRSLAALVLADAVRMTYHQGSDRPGVDAQGCGAGWELLPACCSPHLRTPPTNLRTSQSHELSVLFLRFFSYSGSSRPCFTALRDIPISCGPARILPDFGAKVRPRISRA